MKRIIVLLAVGSVWAASLAWFAVSSRGCPSGQKAKKPAAEADTESWFGIYMGPDKIGYSVTISKSLSGGGRAVSNRSLMRISMLGQDQEVVSALSYDLDPAFRMERFDFRLAGAAEIRVSGQVKAGKLELAVETGGRVQRQEMKLSGPVTLPEALEPMLAGKELRAGDRRTFSVFDPSSMSLQPAVITVAGRESLSLPGGSVWATKLDMEFAGVTTSSWVDSSGCTLREEGPMGIVLVAEPRELALDFGEGPPFDLLTSLSVPSLGATVADPRNASLVRMGLLDVDPKFFDIDRDRQKLDGTMLAIAREDSPQGEIPAPPDSLRPWLASTALIQAGDPGIRALADSISRPGDGAWDKAVAISDWVFRSLEKRMSVTLPSAVEVMRSRSGDCNEHATLFCALARAAGIPARLCLGVVYLDGRFYYHAWNAVWCGRWVEVDPTFGQCPADAARIRLVLGDLTAQNRLLPALGRLKVRVEEAR